jgi:hypothetical protein
MYFANFNFSIMLKLSDYIINRMTIVYLQKSSKPEKKFMVTVIHNDGTHKKVHFGLSGFSDYTIHKDKARMKRYEGRHKSRENWGITGIDTAGFWSKWILWSEPSLDKAVKNTAKKFKITIKRQAPPVSYTSKSFSPRVVLRKTPKRKSPQKSTRRKSPTKKTSPKRKSIKRKSTQKSTRRKSVKRKSPQKSTRRKSPKKTSPKKRSWSRSYKLSINCKSPKGFSQRQYCKYGRKTVKR